MSEGVGRKGEKKVCRKKMDPYNQKLISLMDFPTIDHASLSFTFVPYQADIIVSSNYKQALSHSRKWSTEEIYQPKSYKLPKKRNSIFFLKRIQNYYIDEGYNWHYQSIQGVLTRNKKHLHLGRVPQLFPALQIPATSPVSK